MEIEEGSRGGALARRSRGRPVVRVAHASSISSFVAVISWSESFKGLSVRRRAGGLDSAAAARVLLGQPHRPVAQLARGIDRRRPAVRTQKPGTRLKATAAFPRATVRWRSSEAAAVWPSRRSHETAKPAG